MRKLHTAVYDGLLQGLLLYLIGGYITSVYTQSFSLVHYVCISCVFAIITAVCFFLLLQKEKSNKRIAIISLLSSCSFLLSAIVIFINQLTLSINIFPIRPLDNSDGLIILLTLGTWIVLSALLRLIVLLFLIIRNKIEKRTKDRGRFA